MKKFIAILLTAVLCVSLAGCGDKDSGGTSVSSSSSSSKSTAVTSGQALKEAKDFVKTNAIVGRPGLRYDTYVYFSSSDVTTGKCDMIVGYDFDSKFNGECWRVELKGAASGYTDTDSFGGYKNYKEVEFKCIYYVPKDTAYHTTGPGSYRLDWS